MMGMDDPTVGSPLEYTGHELNVSLSSQESTNKRKQKHSSHKHG